MTEQIGLDAVFNTSAFSSGLSKYTSGLDSAIGKTTSAGGMIGSAIATAASVGIAAIAALATATVVAAGTIVGSIISIDVNASKMAHDLELLNAKTNLSTTALQEWNVAGELVGVTADDIATYYMRLSRSAYAASLGTKASVDAYAQLGIKVTDAKGKLKDTTQLFYEAVDALGKMTDPTKQDAVAMLIFGRSAMDLMPLIKAGTASMKDLTQEAQDVGAVLDEKLITSLGVLDDHLHFIQAGVKGLSQTFAGKFVPVLNDVTGLVIDLLKGVNSGMPLTAGKTFMDKISSGMTTGLKTFKTNAPKIMAGIVKWLTTALPLVVTFGADIISTLADGLGTAYSLLFPAGANILNVIMKALQDNWPKIEQAGRDVIGGLGKGLQDGWALIAPNLPSIGNILSWIFNTGNDLSAQFLTWVQGVPWTKLSDDVAAAISALPWSTMGIDLAGIGTNLWSVITDVLFGGTQNKNAGTMPISSKTVGGIDWGALGKAIIDDGFKKLDDAFTTALLGHPHVTDVDLSTLFTVHILPHLNDKSILGASSDDITNAINSWLLAAFRNVTVWHGLDEAINLWYLAHIQNPIVNTFANIPGWMMGFIDGITSVFNGTTVSWTPVDEAINLWWLIHFQIPIENLVNNIILWVQDALGGLGKIIGSGVQRGGITVPPNDSTVPSNGQGPNSYKNIPVPNITPITVNPNSMAPGNLQGARTNNITINNPTAESASNSLNSTLVRLSYLGVV